MASAGLTLRKFPKETNMRSTQPLNKPGGYMGRILRVDLSKSEFSEEQLASEEVLRQYVGGTGTSQDGDGENWFQGCHFRYRDRWALLA